MHEAKGNDEGMQEQEGEEEEAATTFIDHPEVELLQRRAGHVGSHGPCGVGV